MKIHQFSAVKKELHLAQIYDSSILNKLNIKGKFLKNTHKCNLIVLKIITKIAVWLRDEKGIPSLAKHIQ